MPRSWRKWNRVENGRNKLVRRCFFLIPKNVTSERPLALMPTLIRWWEALRAPDVAKWLQKYRVHLGCYRRANWRSSAQSVWEVFMEMKRFNGRAKSRRKRTVALVAGPCEGIRASQPTDGLGLGDALQLPKEDVAGAVWSFQAPEASAVRRLRGGAAPDHHGHLARVQVELFAFTHCSAKNPTVFEAEGFCG